MDQPNRAAFPRLVTAAPATRSLPDGHHRQRKDHLMAELGHAPSRIRRRWVLAVLIPALLLATTGAAVLISRQPPPIKLSFGCYTVAALDANTAIVTPDGRSPIAACAELWAGGAMISGRTTVPTVLEACVLPDGPVGVFPGERPGVCERLGLPAADLDGYAGQAGAVRRLEAGINQRLGGCVGREQAIARARQELAERNFTGWDVEVAEEGWAGNRPCAIASIDEQARKVILRGNLSGLWDDLGWLDPGYRCVASDQAEAFARRKLADRGFEGWQVTVDRASFSRKRPCSVIAPQSHRTFVISGAEPVPVTREDGTKAYEPPVP